MPLVCFGLSHRSATLDLVEAVSLSDERLTAMLVDVFQEEHLDEIACLSTCNRLEFYFFKSEVCHARRALLKRLSEESALNLRERRDQFYVLHDEKAVEHLFRVACGIDSLVVGENQILGQIRIGLERARELKTIGSNLLGLFERALNLGRRVRHETAIGRGDVSVASVAVSMTTQIFDDLEEKRVLVIGAGDTAKRAARSFRQRGVQFLTLANRSRERAEGLARELEANLIGLDQLDDELAQSDLVVSATSAEHFLLTPEQLSVAAGTRTPDAPLVVLDLALPRNVDPAARDLSNVRVYSLKDLEQVAEENLAQREAEIPKVEMLIVEETARYERWLNSNDAKELANALHRRIEETRRQHLERFGRQFPVEQQPDIDRLTQSLLRSVLHDVTLNIRSLENQSASGAEKFDFIRHLFNLPAEEHAIAPLPEDDEFFGLPKK